MNEHNNKVPAPCECRIKTASSRFCMFDSAYYEVSMVGPGSQGLTMYQLFTSPGLDRSVTMTIERLTFKKAKVTYRINEDHLEHERDALNKRLYALIKSAEFILPLTAKTGDADLILAATRAHAELVQRSVKDINASRIYN